MCKSRLFFVGFLCVVLVLLTSCVVTLKHGKLNTPASPAAGTMAVAADATNMKSKIGSGTFTVFAIPVAKVTVQGEASKELMVQIKDAVTQMGYESKIVEKAEDSGDAPILTCNINKFKFKNYTWFFPIVFNWGSIIMEVAVKSPDGNILWNKTYTAKGSGSYSFNRPVSKALTRILNQMIADMTTPDFQQKVLRKEPGAPGNGRDGSSFAHFASRTTSATTETRRSGSL